MRELFEVKEGDRRIYEKHIRDFLPEKIIDVHAHVWLEKHTRDYTGEFEPVRAVTWPKLVARDNSIEDLVETYGLMFPGKEVTPLIFGSPNLEYDIYKSNEYVARCSKKHGFPALMLARPEMGAREILQEIKKNSFLGLKVYLNYANPHIPQNEIRISDFVTGEQLEVLNGQGLVLMLHIPGKNRLKDPVNLMELMEIEKKYPRVKLIVAHVGRAYCVEDLGNAFEVLSSCENMVFDISANCNREVFKKLIKAVGPKRILFGSDMPILRMRTKRICVGGRYINLVERGAYGDVSGDPNMKEVGKDEADDFTFFMYEEILAFKEACLDTGLSEGDMEDVFYNNGKRILFGGLSR